ncbi:MAG: hypothetical protein ACRBN8_22795 [Nannocystales bacterium]
MTTYATTTLLNNNTTVTTIQHTSATSIVPLRLETDNATVEYDNSVIDEIVFTPYTGLAANSYSVKVRNANGDISHAFIHDIPTGSNDVRTHEFESTGAANWTLKVTTKPET